MLRASSFGTSSSSLDPKAVLLLTLALVTGVILVIVVVLVRGVELLLLGVVSDEVGGVAHSKQPLSDLLLSL
jgi:hypothetical protein